MKRLVMGLVFALAALISIAGWAQEFPLVVTGICFEGNVEIEDEELLDVLNFTVGQEISEADVRASSQAIFDLGWFGEVAPNIVGEGEIVFHVVENPVLREIVITGNVNRRTYSLLGIDLFSLRIMPSYVARQILWSNDVRKRSLINRNSLLTALDEIVEDYKDSGYILVAIGDVEISETLRIELIEPLITANTVSGLRTVPASVAEDMIDLPLGELLQRDDLQRVSSNLRNSIFIEDFEVVPEMVGADTAALNWTLAERELISEAVRPDGIVLQGVTTLPEEEIVELVKQPDKEEVDNYGLLVLLEDVYREYMDAGLMMARFDVLGIDDGVLFVEVEEGLISDITLVGNTVTHDYVVMRNLDFEVGRVFDRSDYITTYQHLNSLGYFGTVDIVPEWGDEGVTVSITVTERGSLGGFNGSMAMDPSTGGLVGELSIKQKNLAGTGQDVSLSYSRGIAVEDEPEVTTWDLGYSTVAYFPDFDRVGLDLYRSTKEINLEEETLNAVILGGEISFSYPLVDFADVGLSFKHEEERIQGSAEWTPTDALSVAVIHDSTNDLIFPTDGGKRALSLEKAGGFSAGTEYVKVTLLWTDFVSVENRMFGDRDQTLATCFRVGLGDGNLPETQFYVLGGSTSVRGVDEVSVPRRLVYNLEYRVELVEGLSLGTFFDAGVNLDSVRVDDFLASAGLEFGIAAAGMFFRLDIVWRLDSERDWLPRFDLGFGPMF